MPPTTSHRADPRIAPLTDPDDSLRAVLDGTIRRGGDYQHIFLTLAHRPDLLTSMRDMGGQFLVRGQLDPVLREVAILRVAGVTGCAYEYGQHALLAARLGMTPEQVEAATLGTADDPAHRAVIAVVEELSDGCDLTDATWAAALGALGGDEGLMMELVLLVGFYRMVAGFLRSAGVVPDDGLPPLPT